MASESQLIANRANAQFSTGPVTSAGKARASQNAVTHGLASRNIFLPGEDPAEWHALRDHIAQSFHSGDSLLLDLATHAAWKLRRIEEWTTMLLAAAFDSRPVPTPLALLFSPDHETAMRRLERYESAARSALNRALSLLREQARQRAAAEQTQSPASPRPPRVTTNPIPPLPQPVIAPEPLSAMPAASPGPLK